MLLSSYPDIAPIKEHYFSIFKINHMMTIYNFAFILELGVGANKKAARELQAAFLMPSGECTQIFSRSWLLHTTVHQEGLKVLSHGNF
jgi:hypothetical protein